MLEGGGRRGEGDPPPKKFQNKKFVAINFLEGHQGMLEGGGGREWSPTFPKKISKIFFFGQKIPRRGHCSRRPPGGAKGGKERAGSSPPSKKTKREAPHNNLVNNKEQKSFKNKFQGGHSGNDLMKILVLSFS